MYSYFPTSIYYCNHKQ